MEMLLAFQSVRIRAIVVIMRLQAYSRAINAGAAAMLAENGQAIRQTAIRLAQAIRTPYVVGREF